jgi:hypothetical protein
MKMKSKMTVVASALIIGLMLIGFSYALWYKYLVIYGTVKTGKLDAWFTDYYWGDSQDEEGTIPVPEVKRIYTVDFSYGELPSGEPDFEFLNVAIDHLYPCIWIHVYFEVTNTGTIPLKFQYYFYQAGNNTGGPFPGDVILTGNLYGLQLEPGESAWGDVHIHLNNDALQDQPLGTYYFVVYLMPVQWNEFDPTLGPVYD